MKENKLIEKQCVKCGEKFDILSEDVEFYKKVSPKFNWKIYEIPAPSLCPTCREQRRLSFRNERNLYKRKCSATWEPIISMFSPDKSYKVYNYDFWWSDKWDATEYGRDFDFSRPFFEQFEELMKDVPWPSLIWVHNENSPYINFWADNKNCYMIFASSRNEDSYYSRWIFDSKDIVDSNEVYFGNDSYYMIQCKNVYNSKYCVSCVDCSNCEYCYDLQWCSNCYGCYNLRNKQYCILNKQYTKEEYYKELEKIKNNPISLKEIYKKAIHKNLNIINSENCIGDNLTDCKNCYYVFNSEWLENCKYVYNWYDMKDSYDVTFQAYGTFLLYDIIWTEKANKSAFNYILIDSYNCYYNILVFNSSNCFWCVWLKNKQYCILNKQYTKEEYEELVPKIIEHMKKTWEWWEFFPSSISPFGYNETLAYEFYPMTKQKAVENGFKWSDYEKPTPKVDKIIPAQQLPKDIEEVNEDILNMAIECEVSKKPFRIIAQELKFYKKHNLPLPTKHPDVRHMERMNFFNPRKIFERKCAKCGKEIKTTYPPDSSVIVYCEECYEKEVY